MLQFVEDLKCFLTPSSSTQNSSCRCVGAENFFKTLFQDSIVINLLGIIFLCEVREWGRNLSFLGYVKSLVTLAQGLFHT